MGRAPARRASLHLESPPGGEEWSIAGDRRRNRFPQPSAICYTLLVGGKAVFSIDVRDLAERLFQEGSIGVIVSAGRAAQRGIETHRKMQGRGIPGYRAEVALSRVFNGDHLDFELSGRADGVYDKDGITHVEEIKSTRRNTGDLRPGGNPVHEAQLSIYGWLYCLEYGRESITLDLIYVHRQGGEERTFSTVRTRAELEESHGRAVQGFLSWLDRHEGRRQELNQELASLDFPFPDFRPGQREAAKEVFRAIRDGGTLFLQAPTGIGKTIAVLYAAVKALGQGFAAKLFYLTAKNSGAAAAEKALAMLARKTPHLRWISITAKSKICFLTGEEGDERPPCDPDTCPFARDYFAKVKTALFEVFDNACFPRPLIEELARRHEVCPFELSLDLSLYCDVIVADCNYAFDYTARLMRYFAMGKTNFAFLVDEAHNLVDRARSMFSERLSKRRILEARRASSPAEKKILSGLNSALLALKDEFSPDYQEVRMTVPAGLHEAVAAAIDGFDELIERGAEYNGAVLELYWELCRLRIVLDHYDESYRTIVSRGRSELLFDFLCIDPSTQIEAVLAGQRAAIFFSGTLSPARYFTSLIAPDMKPELIELPSPFPPENCAWLHWEGLSTRWKDRERNMDLYADVVREVFRTVPGNVIVFSPSFAFQESLVTRVLHGGFTPEGWVLQRPGMTNREKDGYLAAFQEGPIRSAAPGVRGFAVCGGSLSESIDLIGDRLVGAVVFGVGLPQVSFTNDVIKDFFEAKLGSGYAWAYLYPGLNRVLQAAGRVIRSETDRGFVCLVDERWTSAEYRRLLPAHWDVKPVREPGDFARLLPAGLSGQ